MPDDALFTGAQGDEEIDIFADLGPVKKTAKVRGTAGPDLQRVSFVVPDSRLCLPPNSQPKKSRSKKAAAAPIVPDDDGGLQTTPRAVRVEIWHG